MARGAKIIVTADWKGLERQGYIADGSTVLLPGTIWQRDASVALRHGEATYKIYQPGADGENPLGGYWVLLENIYLGRPPTEAWAAGDFARFYSPRNGEELNLVVANLAGTADDHALGAKLMVDHTTGKLIATTGSPEDEVAELLEAIVDPTADTLAWCEWAK
jgi:hypothetical protein